MLLSAKTHHGHARIANEGRRYGALLVLHVWRPRAVTVDDVGIVPHPLRLVSASPLLQDQIVIVHAKETRRADRRAWLELVVITEGVLDPCLPR